MPTEPMLAVFEPAHIPLAAKRIREELRTALDGMGDLSAYGELALASGHCWTAVADGKVIACGGVVDFGDGSGEAWLLPTQDVLSHRVWFARTIARVVGELFRRGVYRKLSALVRPDFPQAVRFAERLGFVFTQEEVYGTERFRRYVKCIAS